METHFVDRYIQNKRKSSESQSGTPSSSSFSTSTTQQQPMSSSYSSTTTALPATTTTTSSTTTGAYRGPSSATSASNAAAGGGAGGGSYYPSSSSYGSAGAGGGRPNSSSSGFSQAAHHVLLSAAHRAQHEVDQVSNAAAELAMKDEQNERLERQYHLLSERVDTANLQVASAEDKVINVTKMLKMLQQLSEDREKSLRDDSGELRSKVKRLERQLEQEREAREKMSESMTTYVRETIERSMEAHGRSVRADFTRQIESMDQSIRGVSRQSDELKVDLEDVRRVAEKFNTVLREVEQFCSRFAEETRSSTKTLVESRLEEFRFRQDAMSQKVDDLREKTEDFHDRMTESNTTQHELRRSLEDCKRREEPLKNWVEDRVGKIRGEVHENVQKETDSLRSHLHVALANTSQCIEANESGVNDLRDELSKLATSLHSHVKSGEAHTKKTSENVEDLREITTQSRDLLANQLEATKEWASRNILRLKKHLDLAVSDMAATRQAQLEIQCQFQRLTQAHSEEKNALMAQLNLKTKEASLLTQAVDKEVAEVAHMMNDFEESRRHAQAKRQAKNELRTLSEF